MTVPAEHLPPHNLEAEEAVLGSVLMDRDAIATLGPLLSPDDFYSAANGDIWLAMKALWRKRQPADLVTVKAELERNGRLDMVGGIVYLSQLLTAVPTAVHGDYYATLVSQTAMLRRLITAGQRMVSRAWQPGADATELITEARRWMADAMPQQGPQTSYSMTELSEALSAEIERRLDPDYQPDVVRTGLHDFDQALTGGGFERGQLITLGARPSIGKTAMGMQIVKNYARYQVATNPDPYWTVIFSAEMTAIGLMWRALTETTHMSTDVLKEPRNLSAEQLALVQRELRALAELPIIINEKSAPTTDYMQDEIERLKARHPVRFVMFDYIGLAGNKHHEGETQRYAQISSGLKATAKACDVSVLALAQLNRNVESRPKGDKRPRLSDFNQSGQIEADADVALGMYRHDYYVGKGMEDFDPALENVAELIVLKQRDGGTPLITVQFTPETTSFHSITRRDA